MAELEQNRSEPATPFKLTQARRRGSVAKSLEVSSLFALLTLLAVLMLDGRRAVDGMLRLGVTIIDHGGRASFEAGSALRWLEWVGSQGLALLMPLLLGIVAVAVLGGLLQAGPVFAPMALKPDIERINPVAGFKRLFSIRLLFETAKNLLKTLLFGAALWLLFQREIADLLALTAAAPAQVLHTTLSHAQWLIFKLTLIVAAIAMLDMMFTRWHWLDRLKMSRREIREELKHREGDPRVRARMRELRREMLARAKSVRRLPEADVLITNPTHLAVALLYRREAMSAPELIAKASGEAALQMRALARRHRVPVVENPTLARALFERGTIDAAIPEQFYPPVARLLVWIYALREGRR